ncbi:MAG: right-handed parallel beta-helix repeat-containing protein [Fidelibacterota bacterium]
MDPLPVDLTLFGNDIQEAGSAGIRLDRGNDIVVEENRITDGLLEGLVMVENPQDIRVFHNSIFGNQGFQVSSDVPGELSFRGEGNYWGRSSDPLFVPGVDSNREDLVPTPRLVPTPGLCASHPWDAAVTGTVAH